MLKWIGHLKGIEGIAGIPARNLTDDEVENCGGEKTLLATGLYERPYTPPPPRPQVVKSKGEEPVDE